MTGPLTTLVNKALNQGATKGNKMTTAEKKITCKQCGRDDFKAPYELATHVRVDHPKPKGRTGKLTASEVSERFAPIIRKCAEDGTAETFQRRPDWKDRLLASAKDMHQIYLAVSHYRRRTGIKPEEVPTEPRKAPDGRRTWTTEQYAVAHAIARDPRYNFTGHTKWIDALVANPQWMEALNVTQENLNDKALVSFFARARMQVKKGFKPPVSAQTNGHVAPAPGVRIAGKDYSLEELEELIAERKQAVKPLNFCPNCGHNLLLQSKAFTIATRHAE